MSKLTFSARGTIAVILTFALLAPAPAIAAKNKPHRTCMDIIAGMGLTRRQVILAGLGLGTAAVGGLAIWQPWKDSDPFNEKELQRKYGAWLTQYKEKQTAARTSRAGDDAFVLFTRQYGAMSPFEATSTNIESRLGVVPYLATVEGHRIADMIEALRDVSFIDLEEPRNKQISVNISRIVKDNPEGNLLIVFAGALHIYQYYLESGNRNAIYASYKIDENTKYGTSFTDALKTIGYKNPSERFGKQSPVMFQLMALETLYQHQRKSPISIENVLVPDLPSSSSGVILIADHHGYQDSGLARALPPASYWKDKGYKSVTLALEELPAGKSFDRARTYELTRLPPSASERVESIQRMMGEYDRLLAQVKALPQDEQRAVLARPEIQKAVKELEIIRKAFQLPAPWHLPELFDLLKKADEYSEVLEVNYVGIDVPK